MKKVIIVANFTIWGIGFGYEEDAEKLNSFMPHLRNMIIKSGVSIGSNVCINRVSLGF